MYGVQNNHTLEGIVKRSVLNSSQDYEIFLKILCSKIS